jgi:peroxiredoxin
MRLLFYFIAIIVLSNTCFAREDVKTLQIGASAPNFKLTGIDDKVYTLESFTQERILTIIFTANHCPTAQAYEGRIKQLAKDYRDKGVKIVAISSNNPQAVRLDEMGYTDLGDSFEEMKRRAKEAKFNFPYLYDGDDQQAIRAFGATATPHVFIFDMERKLRFVGRIDDSENFKKVTTHDTRNAIDALLADKKVPLEKTKAFGCSIKWAEKIPSSKKAVEGWNKETVVVEMANINDIKELVKNRTENLRFINFWATWCGPCISEFPELVEIFRMYRNRDFEMVTVSADTPEKNSKVLKFLKKMHASMKNFHFNSDNKYDLIEAVDKDWPGSLPYTLIIKPGGEILFKKLGPVDPYEVKKIVVEYLGRYYEKF